MTLEKLRRIPGASQLAGALSQRVSKERYRDILRMAALPLADRYRGVSRGFRPAMQLSCDVAAYLDSHPAPTVVVDPIHIVISVVSSMLFADHRMPRFREVIPTSAFLCQADKDRPHRASRCRMRSTLVRQQDRNAFQMPEHHLISQDLAPKQP